MTVAGLALAVGVAVSGLVTAFLIRAEARKMLNLIVLTLGTALLAYGHLEWAVRRESPEVKLARYFRPIAAGWALVGMGFIGLQGRSGHRGKPEP